MASKAKIAQNERRKKLVAKYAPVRKKLKAIMKDPKASEDEKDEAQAKLQKLPRDASPVRIRNRCVVTGRPRAYYRKFGLSRIALRDLGLAAHPVLQVWCLCHGSPSNSARNAAPCRPTAGAGPGAGRG